MRSVRFFAALLAVSVILAPAAGAEPTEVGTTAATNTDTRGTPPRMATRNLFIGTNVFFEERIETSKTGQAQLLFLDESALTIASNSDVVLDKFIYDPKTSKGELALSLGAGLFRFVGGRISKTTGVTIKTPTATIGIRGGIVIIKVEPGAGATRATFMFGKEMTVTNNSGVTRRVTRPGFYVDVASKDDEPSPPRKVSGVVIASYLTELEGRTGQTAGSDDPPTDEQVADSGCCPPVDPGEIVSDPTAANGGTDGGTLPPEAPECCDFTETNPIPSRTLNGFSGGVFEFFSGEPVGTELFVNTSIASFSPANPADIEILIDVANGTVKAEFDVARLNGEGTDRLDAIFGDIGATSATSFSIDDPTASAKFDGAPAITASLFLKTSDMVVLPAGDFCKCEFLQWGSWSGEIERDAAPSVFVDLFDADPEVDIALAYWVAGEITIELPVSGTAIYSGHLIGIAIDEGGVHPAVGGFSQTYNFATNSGEVDITSFDEANIDANFDNIPVTGGGAGFTGSGPDTSNDFNINLQGAFFKGGGDPIAQVGGGFNITGGEAYNASGIFAADKQ